ncbi:DNA polymerase nu isoform X2 [Narcine bancroftii]|uniref:DNA polymerase nu isoform X2 n=1 Tax=Narcine bancroftii TaxID=1343680 RepID=UPI003831C707
MENKESHGWCAGLDHKQISTHAQQIIKAIRSEHTRRMQKSGDNKCYMWHHEMEELSTEGQNVRKGGTLTRFQEVEYWNAMEREEANSVEFQPYNVTMKKVDRFHTEAYTKNQTEQCGTDRPGNAFHLRVHAAMNQHATKCHLPAGSANVNVTHKEPFSRKEFLTSERKKIYFGGRSECTSVQHAVDPSANQCQEAQDSMQSDMRVHKMPAYLDPAPSMWQHYIPACPSSSAEQHLELPGRTKTERLSSAQEDNCLKRKRAALKWEKEGGVSRLKQPGLDGVLEEVHGHGTGGLDSAQRGSRPHICDLITLDSEQRPQVLEEVARAAVIIITLVYQDGSTQLTAQKEHSTLVSGFLMLLINRSDGLFPVTTAEPHASEHTGHQSDAGGRYFHLKLDCNFTWLQGGTSYREFSRTLLLYILGRNGCIIAFKAKDLLRTVLQYCADSVCWKQASSWEILDPQIAGWLLEPTDTSPCFKGLVLKHCGTSSSLVLTHSNTHSTGNSKLQELCADLLTLHCLMIHLRAKLQSQHLWMLYCTVELRLIPVLAVMENYRIQVNKEELKRTSELLGVRQKQLEKEAHQMAGEQFLLTSSNQLRQVLFDKLHLVCEKKLLKTDLKQQSTSEAVLLQLQELHPLPKIILEYRQIRKIKSTYIDGLLACTKKGFVSPTWNQTAGVSGRLSAKHPNIQAIPTQPIQIAKVQQLQGSQMDLVTISPRNMFVSSDGWTFLAADFSHIELRILAHLTSDPELLKLFQEPEPPDIFSTLASQWKGIPVERVRNADREQAKRIVYALVYGAGKDRLSEFLRVSTSQASQFIESFLQKYKEVRTFTQRTIQQCHQRGYVVSIMGRRRSLPLINAQDYSARNQAERQAVNFVVQGSAADICKMAMIKIFMSVASSSSLTARLVAQIHDELLFEVEHGQIQEAAGLVKRTMESLRSVEAVGVHLKVPLKVSLSTGKTWGSMKEL